MKIINELPPVWDSVVKAGMNPDPQNVIFTYGDAIYNPGGKDIPDHLVVHEETHSKQQCDDPDAWWSRYMQDPYFRIQQEFEAYANQYRFICQRMKDRNQRDKVLRQLAGHLSGPTYGNIIGAMAAYKMIKDKANVK